MSRMLVKEALNLHEDGTTSESKTGFKYKAQKLKKKRLKPGTNTQKLKSSIQDLKFKCILDEVKRKKNLNLTEDNLQILKRISRPEAVIPTAVDKIMEHQKGKLAKNSPIEEKTKVKEKSVFTDEDFRKFEEEYFVKWGNEKNLIASTFS